MSLLWHWISAHWANIKFMLLGLYHCRQNPNLLISGPPWKLAVICERLAREACERERSRADEGWTLERIWGWTCVPLAVFVASWAWLANLTRCHNHHKRARHRELHQMLGAMARKLLHFPPKWRHRSHFWRKVLFMTILSILGHINDIICSFWDNNISIWWFWYE
jgi:hypothetical protein